MDYKRAIYKMMEKIEDETALKRILTFVHRFFLNTTKRGEKDMSEENVIRFYETLAEILSRREGVKIKVTIRRKEDGAIVNGKEDVA